MRPLLNFSFSANVLNLRFAVLLTVGTVLLSTLGFVLIEGYSLVDAFYMTVITISTVGFGEVRPLTPAGRVFVSVLVILNIAIVAYALAAFSYFVIEGKLFERMQQSRIQSRIEQLSGHTIVCGFGRYGREIVNHLRVHHHEFVVIEQSEEKIEHHAEEEQLLRVIGDATEDEVLQEAGIERAAGLITALNDDSDNLFIVISAKGLNPGMRVISRAREERNRQKMMRAGASSVILPDQIGGFYMATLMSKPGAVEFFSYITNELAADIGFEEIRCDQLPTAVRSQPLKNLGLRRETGVNIIGHRLADGHYVVNPGPEAKLAPGEIFIAIGNEEQIEKLRRLLV